MMQNDPKTSKNKYNKMHFVLAFCMFTATMVGIRHIFSINTNILSESATAKETITERENIIVNEHIQKPEATEIETETETETESESEKTEEKENSSENKVSNTRPKNKIVGVYSFTDCFPDINDVQLEAAIKNGIRPIHSREEALKMVRSKKLVNITNSPYYTVDDLSHSLPYLVPRAQQLLNTIAVNFIDSLYSKGMPPHMLVVTSVLRTHEDISKLQVYNSNATTQSCHCYGTTVDISYNRFIPITGVHGENGPEPTRWDFNLKLILSEVLNDLRLADKCYVKYEKRQGCFHLTVR